MSGHSKWSTIKRQKGVNDAKRGAVFTRIGNQIAISARSGIQRAIDRVSDKNAAVLQELLYEGYGPGGVAVLVECATDNINRTYPEVRTAFTKNGGNIAEKGSVAFQFERKGSIRVEASGDDAVLSLIELGAEDVIEEDGECIVYTDQKELAKVRDAIIAAGIKIKDAELVYNYNIMANVDSEETMTKVYKLLDALEDIDARECIAKCAAILAFNR